MQKFLNIKALFRFIIQSFFIFLLVFFLSFNDVLYSLDVLLKDKLYQQPRGINNSIKIIGIDEKTLDALGPFGTWPRSTYAKLLDNINKYPFVIGFDIMFMGDMDIEDDNILLNKLNEFDNVVSASHIIFKSSFNKDENNNNYIDHFSISQYEKPFFDSATILGYTNVSSDSDGIVRSILPRIEKYNSFSYEIYSLYCDKKSIEKKEPITDSNNLQWIYYAGKPYEYEVISFIDVLNNNVDPRIFTNCIVLVGAYAPGLKDHYFVPNSKNQMYGVEIHANIIQAMLDEKYPVPFNRYLTSIILSSLCLILFYIFRKIKVKLSTVLFIIIEVIYVFIGIFLFVKLEIIFPLIYGVLFIFSSYLFSLIDNYLTNTLEKRKIENAFKKYVAPQVVDQFIKSKKHKISLGGESKDIAVLFVDIRGFTPLSESLPPNIVVDILNEYLNLTTTAIFNNNGTLDKFIGDATMAIFNAPFDLDDLVYCAAKTALDILSKSKQLENLCMEKYNKKVSFGIGVDSGEAIVGNIGCSFRMDYTAIGDTVNIAARLESNAKPGEILISQQVYEKIKTRVNVIELGEIPLKGKTNTIKVYSLISLKESEDKIHEQVPNNS